jgi:hypothetical protein|tara:strand:- start:374 stop:565 length:192 start_codon:yes stop_codon:yes gene_type:complete
MKLTEAGFVSKLFDKWKQKKLSKTATAMLKADPELEKSFQELDKIQDDIIAKIKKDRLRNKLK